MMKSILASTSIFATHALAALAGKRPHPYPTFTHEFPDRAILEDDIMYKDDLVCVLKPSVKKGVLVWTHYTQPEDGPSLVEAGLTTGQQLHSEGVDFGRKIYHPYNFFRAPFKGARSAGDIDYSTLQTEAESLYGPEYRSEQSRIWIRVDPDQTYVFSSEIRARYSPPGVHCGSPKYARLKKLEVNKSKKTLTQYLNIIHENNVDMNGTDGSGKTAVYHLITSRVLFLETHSKNRTSFRPRTSKFSGETFSGEKFSGEKLYMKRETKSKKDAIAALTEYPLDRHPIERNSEVLVSIPHLTPDYFVKDLCSKDCAGGEPEVTPMERALSHEIPHQRVGIQPKPDDLHEKEEKCGVVM